MAAQKAGSIEGAPGRLATGGVPHGDRTRAAAWGSYVLGRRIGRGAMGVVHAAVHRGVADIARLVAVKILVADRADHPEERAAFLREARILARLDHPNVVRWLDAGEVDGDVFIAMELLHGASLAQVVAASPERLPLPIAIAVLADLARGLHAAHELRDEAGAPLGLVHQDVSPQNAVVGYDGRTRLVDFGIARLASVDASRTDTVRGKPAYLAPEQLEGRRLDRRTDVFALGVIAFEILAGRRLFARASIAETHTAVLFEPIPNLRDVRPDVPPDLAALVACALSRSASGRFPTAEAFRRALLAARDDAGIPAADEHEIARLVESRVPPPWKPHELFAEIARDGAPDEPRVPHDSSAELSQAVTIAPQRAREPVASDVSEEATAAPRRAREPVASDVSEEATAAPRRAREPDPAEEATAAPMRAAAIVGIPSNAAEPPAAIVGIPSNVAEPPATRASGPPIGAADGAEPMPEIPMSRTSVWLRAGLAAGALLAVLAVVVGLRSVRGPSPVVSGSAEAAPTGSIDAPPRRADDVTADPAKTSVAPPMTSLATSSPTRAGTAAAAPSIAASTTTGASAASAASAPASIASGSAPAPIAPPTTTAAASGTPSTTDAPAAPTNGWISVWSTPWGHVRIDGRDVGDSPAVRIAASPGSHTVSVKSDAGEQARGVTVKAGEESKVRFVF